MTRSMKLANSMARSTVTFSSTFTEEICKATCRAIKNLLACDGYVVAGQEREQTSIDNIVDLFSGRSDSQAVKLVKYLTAIYLPMLLGDDLPSRPDFLSPEATLFRGEYGRYIKRLFQCEPGRPSRRAISLATSILQIKRYLPSLSKKLKLEALRGCQERLTAVRSTPKDVLEHIEYVTELFFPAGWDHRPGPWSVTNKSCFESSRAEGGAQEYMFKERHPLHLIPKPLVTKKSKLELVRETIDRLEGKVFKGEGKSIPSFTIPPTQSNGYELVRMDANSELRGHPLRVVPEEYVATALDTLPSQLQAKMEIVDDPLKARVITKNNWQCTILKPLQKMIHTRLRNIPMFELLGKPISTEIIDQIPLFEGSKWVSGDYEAATDNLNADCTNACLRVILANMTGVLSKSHGFMYLAARSLTNLSIFSEETGWFTQTNGQLMGSLLSFPILCLVNYAMWHYTAWHVYQKPPTGMMTSGKWDTVRVNGDDIAFPATPEFYESWKLNVSCTGLKPSLGKNYFSNRMVTLNSQPFIVSKDLEGNDKVVQVRWLNQGLLKPPDDDESNPLESLGTMHDDFVRGAEDKRYASGIFIKEHQKMLKTTFRNLFGPREFGGLGAHPIKGTRGEDAEAYDLRQLYVAKLLQEDKIRLPSHSAQTQYTHYIESYVKCKFPNLVQGNLQLLDTAPLGYRWEDVTERVDECRVSLESATAWLGPLLVKRKDVNDHHFLRSLLKQLPKVCKLEGLPWDDYMSFPEETSLYQLMQDVDDSRLQVSFNERVAQSVTELLGLPRNENEDR